ncbi:glycosyltransferase [Erwiniaceae bacterium L1_54_6]|nr:glycosyltransferase [Erwiniaceae bacterium L1_54_6]
MRELTLKNDINEVLKQFGFRQKDDSGVWFPEKMSEFGYNDGDEAENYILNVVSNALDLSVTSDELAEKMIDWPSTYHLSPRRANLLRPFSHLFHGKRVLEIGCGCGAISRFLGESGAQVVSVEGSFRRASIARARCRDLDNVEIICNPADKLPDLGKFDFVLLIGVLEYSRVFVGVNGEDKLLSECYSRLSDEGKLFVAIENKLGIKYFSGAHEDHVNQPMFGINNSYTDKSVVTFGRQELIAKLCTAGFINTQEFLPLPDYKLPTSIVTPVGWRDYSPELCQLAVESIHKDQQLSFEHVFSAEQGTRNVWNNKLAVDLANSFLMISAKHEQEALLEDVAAIHYSDVRLAEFSKTIEFIRHDDGALRVHTRKKDAAGVVSGDEDSTSITDFYQGNSLWFELTHLLNRPNWELSQVSAWAQEWIKQLLSIAELPVTFDKDVTLPDSYQDALPFNVISPKSGEYHLFDLEWTSNMPTLGYIAFRGIFHSLLRITSLSHSEHCPTVNISELTYIIMNDMGFGVDKIVYDTYLHKEAAFLGHVQHDDERRIYETLKSLSLVVRAKRLININLLEAAQAEAASALNQLNEVLARSEDYSGELALDIYNKNRQITTLSETITELENAKNELERVNQSYAAEHTHQQRLLGQYHADMQQILNSFSWRLTSPLRVIGRRLPVRFRAPVKRVFMYAFRLLQPLKVKVGLAFNSFKQHSARNGTLSTLKVSARRLARASYYRLPLKYRHKALTIAMKLYPRGFAHHPEYNAVAGQSAGSFATYAHPAFINHNAKSGYSLTVTPDEYIYIPAKKPFYYDDIVTGFSLKPKFSIIVPIYNTPLELFELMVSSVREQWYGNWELILANDASPRPEIVPVLKKAAESDERIKVVHLRENQGIAGATNVAIDNATGDYIVFLDHDDELTHDCLFELVKCINDEDPDFIYSDEDKLTPDRNYTQPHFKPDWSPETMMSTMYTCHVSCVRTALAKQLGGLRSEFDGCQDWDFVLRVSEMTDKISHISKVLYHWRIIPASIASDITAKPYVLAASKAVREQALERRQLQGVVEELPGYHGYFRVNYQPVNNPLVSIIIPTRDNVNVLARCVESLTEKTRYKNYEIIIVDNGSVDEKTLELLTRLNEQEKITVLRHDIPFNFSELNNFGVSNAAGEILLFLNDDTEILHEDWLERMVGYAQLEHVGAVGAKLLYPDGKSIQHAGVLNLQNGPSHAFLHQNKDYPGYFLRNQIEYNWLIVTGACLMVERKKFEAISGFDESFPIAYNDVDLCMSLSSKGYYNVMCQGVNLIHHESISRGVDHIDEQKALRLKGELNRLNIKHPEFYQFDPYFNRNLSPNGYNFEIMK